MEAHSSIRNGKKVTSQNLSGCGGVLLATWTSAIGRSSKMMALPAARRLPASFCVSATKAACAAAAATRGPTIAARNATYMPVTVCQM